MPLRVVAFGNPLQIAPFGFLGADVVDPGKETMEEELKALLNDSSIGMLLISMDVARKCEAALGKASLHGPTVLVIPDGLGEDDPAGRALRKLVTEAVGVDLLGKERLYGNNN